MIITSIRQRLQSFVRAHEASPIFYIQAPGYTPLSGGVRACHLLCHELNRLGYETYVTAPIVSGTLWTPILTSEIASAHEKAGRRPIAIYPEIYTSNDLNCDRVIRYLLNKPGVFSEANPDVTNEFWQSPSRKSEFHIHFAEEFRVPHLNSVPLYTPLVDESIFFEVVDAKRDGFLVYSRRCEVHDAMIPDWARPYTLVSMASPRSPQELSDLYRRSRGLIVFERTGALMEAAMCGCPAVAIPSAGFSQMPMVHLYGKVGRGWGADVEQLHWAQRTLRSLQRAYRAQVRAYPARLAEMIDAARRFFASIGRLEGSNNRHLFTPADQRVIFGGFEVSPPSVVKPVSQVGSPPPRTDMVARATTIVELPRLNESSSAPNGWDLIEGLNAEVLQGSAVVSGQHILRLVAVGADGRHALGVRFDNLAPGGMYRATAWIKADPGVRVMIEARDSFDPHTRKPANYGVARFLAARSLVNSTGDILASGVDAAADDWVKVWVDLRSSDGQIFVLIGLLEGSNNRHVFTPAGQRVIFGGFEISRR